MRPIRSHARSPLLPNFAAFVLAAGSAAAQVIQIFPPEGPIDEPVAVRVEGLAPGQPFVLRAALKDAEGRDWQSWAGYLADGEGRADLANLAPRHGSFDGPGTDGLFSSMDLTGDGRGRARFSYSAQLFMQIRLTAEVSRQPVATATVTRYFRPPSGGVEQLREAGLAGTLFRPPGGRPAPGVLVIGGSEGGIPEATAAVLSGRGFAALAVGYFGVPGLPDGLERIPLEGFDRAIAWLLRQPGVIGNRVGVVGTSKGAEAALLLGSGSGRVGVIVAYAPSSVAWSCICPRAGEPSWTRAGQPVAFIPPGTDPTYAPPAGTSIEPAAHYLYRLGHVSASRDAEIPVERISAPVLLVWGHEDRLWPSAESVRRIQERRRRAAKVPFAELGYAGAGHLIGLPGLPAGSTIVGGRLETGGSPRRNAAASRDSWTRVIAFLDRALRPAGEGQRNVE